MTHCVIRWIKAKSGSWETVRDQIDPEELNWNESFGHTKNNGKENADDFTNVGRTVEGRLSKRFE